jgi:hypothetical protein
VTDWWWLKDHVIMTICRCFSHNPSCFCCLSRKVTFGSLWALDSLLAQCEFY